MSTHNIGFYEDLTKIIFELSSNMHLISSAVKCSHNGLPFLMASFMRNNAALSFTEPPPLQNSALARISQPKIRATSGENLFPTRYDINKSV